MRISSSFGFLGVINSPLETISPNDGGMQHDKHLGLKRCPTSNNLTYT